MKNRHQAYFQTPIGTARITGDGTSVVSLEVLDEKFIERDVIPDYIIIAINQLNEYFEGERKVFDFPIAPQGTEFQRKVWSELSKIPYGKTISYAEQSKRMGDLKAIRAIATANGKNPLWIVVPCHRVVGSNGSLTGYAGGLWRKKWLLEHEKCEKQQSLF
ncbi:methylated-DNA--[protein]-cysteine S-methyltransferase [Namhaeicola litoreus]|uniref:Methylated-DNA--protein-cysteine methyltransferase n=1 Tax=Namhaeicola litoreus TaxID=1052145 RepID=A0ABW3Y2A5_9FLAO